MRNHVTTAVVYGLLIAYSVVLLGIEWTTSQDYVRHFFTDVTGPVPFYAVNTTLSVSLLWGAALLFGVSAFCSNERKAFAARNFFLSQMAIFFWLGFDDRFQFHEKASALLKIRDEWILLAVAGVELALLLKYSRIYLSRTAIRHFISASILFVGMIIIDGLFPHDLVLRLSSEDILKTWACFQFALAAWSSVQFQIRSLRDGGEQTTSEGLHVSSRLRTEPSLARGNDRVQILPVRNHS